MRLRLHAEFAPAGVLGVSALSFVSTDKTKRTDRRKLWQVQHLESVSGCSTNA